MKIISFSILILFIIFSGCKKNVTEPSSVDPYPTKIISFEARNSTDVLIGFLSSDDSNPAWNIQVNLTSLDTVWTKLVVFDPDRISTCNIYMKNQSASMGFIPEDTTTVEFAFVPDSTHYQIGEFIPHAVVFKDLKGFEKKFDIGIFRLE